MSSDKLSDSNGHENGREAPWGRMSPVEHSVQIYATEAVFLDSLEGFVGGGLRTGESVIVFATSEHRKALDDRLRARGVGLDDAQREDRYIALDAQRTLDQFMVKGWPDEVLFRNTVEPLIQRARLKSDKVRGFGEMVAVLWLQGFTGATVRLEHLWRQLCEREVFPVFCAYPSIGFAHDANDSIIEICESHSRVMRG